MSHPDPTRRHPPLGDDLVGRSPADAYEALGAVVADLAATVLGRLRAGRCRRRELRLLHAALDLPAFEGDRPRRPAG